ncbi:lactase-like protein isoform 3-T3 [Molossus nigricans]
MKPVPFVTLWWVLLLVSRLGATRKESPEETSFYYGTFPLGFSWGVGSSALQTEGSWDQDGKGPSIWDAFTHSGKGKVLGDETADVACDGYYKVQEDIILLRELHVNHYRFSLSWPRLLPTGVRGDQVNEKGIKFYSDFIDALLESNITPIVTLHHWDLPQAHAQAWHSYNNTWRSKQQGMVGISLNCNWGEPVDISNPKDIEAAERYLQFCLGWFANPIYAGDYPQVMKERIGRKSAEQGLDMSRLPMFSLQEKSYIKGTSDFLGLGHFTTWYITERNYPSRQGPSYKNDRDLVELADPNWPDLGSQGLYSVPWGFRRLLNFAQTQYGDPPIYVMENGASQKLHCTQLCDKWRIKYLKGYINEMLKAIKDGANIKGYTSWSLLDKFEWEKGYSDRYGFYYVEFNNRYKPRYPKASVQYYKKIITANGFPNPREVESWYFNALETCSINNQMLAAEPLLSHMQMATEIVVPTVCTLCVLIAAVLILLLRSQS